MKYSSVADVRKGGVLMWQRLGYMCALCALLSGGCATSTKTLPPTVRIVPDAEKAGMTWDDQKRIALEASSELLAGKVLAGFSKANGGKKPCVKAQAFRGLGDGINTETADTISRMVLDALASSGHADVVAGNSAADFVLGGVMMSSIEAEPHAKPIHVGWTARDAKREIDWILRRNCSLHMVLAAGERREWQRTFAFEFVEFGPVLKEWQKQHPPSSLYKIWNPIALPFILLFGYPTDIHPTEFSYMGISGALVENKGLRITHVAPKSPADKAGLRVGDVIADSFKNNIRTESDLKKSVLSYPPDNVNLLFLGVIRDGRRQNITVRLGKLPQGENVYF